MKLRFAAALLACFPGPAFAQSPLSPSDETAAFTAAGFKLRDGQWKACEDDVSASYIPGWIEAVTDLNGDDQPEALVSEGTTFCYGFVGTSYAIVSRQPDGGWKLITSGVGIPRVLATKGVGGWPDIEIGGPGFCFPIERWNGTEYVLDRYEYEGTRCSPQN